MTPSSGPGPICILVIDDDEVDRMAVRRALDSSGLVADSEEARDVRGARELLAERRYDCAVVDFNLPDGDALDVLQCAQALQVPVPVIVLTGQGDEGLAVDLMKEGVRDYIPKNALSPARLSQSIRHVLDVVRAEREARRARETQRFLADVSQQLAQSLDYEATIDRVARLPIPRLADHCVVDIRDAGGTLRRVASAHRDATPPEIREALERFPPAPDSDNPIRNVLETGEPLLLEEIPDTWITATAWSEEAQPLELGRPVSLIVAPLVARGHTLGALSLVTAESGRWFDETDLIVAESLASRAALAIDNARLHWDSEQAAVLARLHAAQLEGLSEAALSINSVLSLDEILQVISDQAREVVGVHQAAIVVNLTDADDQRIEAVSLSEKYDGREVPLPAPGSAIFRTIWESNRPLRLGLEELRREKAEGTVSGSAHSRPGQGWIVAPLVGRDGQGLGLLQLSDKVEEDFTETDEAVLMQLAQLAAVAIENARLFQKVRKAVAARDEMLGVVSHDLRNPLNVITAAAGLVLDIPLPQEKKTEQIQTIRRAAERMNRLIQDLLDVTAIEAGRFAVDPRPEEPAEILDEACDMMDPLFPERGITLECHVEDDLPTVRADRERILQVFSNLMGNAIKYTPKGGTVRIGAERADGSVRFFVEDTGPGVPEEDMPHLFDRFWRGRQRAGNGAGLGLPIARGIVEVHGGEMGVEASAGRGTRFTFTLPIHAPAETGSEKEARTRA